MTKILLVANTDWYLFRFRLLLAKHLRSQGMEVVFVSPTGSYTGEIEAGGFRWVEWYVGRQTVNPFGELKSILSLIRIFQNERPSLVHLHTIKPVLYGSLAARFVKLSAIVRSITGRGYVFLGTDMRAKILRPLVKGIYRLMLHADAGATIFENQTDRQFFLDESLILPNRSLVIEGVGADTDYYSIMPEPEGTPAVLMAGRLLWDKGVGTFIEAARILKQKIDVRFILVGEVDPGNPASIELEVVKNWAAEGIVEWWGWQADMRVAFAASHVVTLPSFGEGIPTILLEAASCGRPIVATNVPGCRDVVQENVNGLLVPPNNPELLAAALAKLLTDPLLRSKMGRQARLLAEQRFSSKHIIAQTQRLYLDLLNGGEKPRG